jgi:hypothetical protein
VGRPEVARGNLLDGSLRAFHARDQCKGLAT